MKIPSSFKSDVKDNHTIVCIGDIHGKLINLKELLLILKSKGLLKNNKLKNCTLVFLGDYIDRGLKSKQVLDKLILLKKNNANNTYFLMGNHELMALSELNNVKRIIEENKTIKAYNETHGINGGKEAIKSYGRTQKSALRNYYELMKPENSHGKFLRSLLPILSLSHNKNDFLFVHAGIPVKMIENNDLKQGLDEFEEKINNSSLKFERTENKFTNLDADPIFWTRETAKASEQDLIDLKSKLRVNYIIIGHTPTDGEIKEKAGLISVDTGMVYGGENQLLMINKEGMFKVDKDKEEKII